MAQGIEAWYYGLPQITRFYLTACFLSTCLSSVGFLNPRSLYLDFDLVWNHFQVWRLTTNFVFLGSFGFPFLMQLMILYVCWYTQSLPLALTHGNDSLTIQHQLLVSLGRRPVPERRRPHGGLRLHALLWRRHLVGT